VLFNALNALKELTLDDPRRASELVQRLADLYRAILDASRTPTSSLAKEAAVAGNYLEVEQARLGDRLRFEVDVPEELAGVEVPALMLQTLVENAVRHGVAKSRTGGHVHVRAERRADEAVIAVTNTGARVDPEQLARRGEAPGGLANTRARLALMFGDAAALTIAEDGERTSVRVVLPARREPS
jgi:LytS/YehU family sensor histidine kinase